MNLLDGWTNGTRRGAGVAAAIAAVALLGIGLVAPATAGDRDRARRTGQDFEWSESVASGKTVEVKGVNGDIIAEFTHGDEVVVTASKHARKCDPDEVRIEVIRHDGGITICAVYPGRRNTCEVSNWSSHTRDNDVVVDFKVQVPEGVRLVARSVNGDIAADGLDGPVEAYTVNGSVRVASNGTARAETVNGSITAEIGSARFSDELEFNTVNGSITLACPARISAAVLASTVNGEIVSDFPVTVQGRMNRHKLQGRIGEGGTGTFKLTTVNGGIHLRNAD